MATPGSPAPPFVLPEVLREALHRDAGPVRPFQPPGVRLLLVLATALLAGGTLIAIVGLRSDWNVLDPALLWAPAAARVLAGIVLVYLGLREGIPGSGPTAPARVLALLGTPVLLILLTEWVARDATARSASTSPAMQGVLGCYPKEMLLALPALVVLVWLLARAYPLRPVFALAAGALGAALISDAALHITCSMTAVGHTLFVHGGAVATIGVVASAAGLVLARSRARLVPRRTPGAGR